MTTIRVRTQRGMTSFEPASSPISIGCSPGATVTVDGPQVATMHATLEYENGHWVLLDTVSAGLFVAGARVPKVRVAGGVQVQLGTDGGGTEIALAAGDSPLPKPLTMYGGATAPSPAPPPPPGSLPPPLPPPTAPPMPSPMPRGMTPGMPTPAAPPLAATVGPTVTPARGPGVRSQAPLLPTVSGPVGGTEIRVRHGSYEKVFSPGQNVRIGRDPGSDIVLDSPLISREHAQIVFGPLGWELVDAGSKRGVFHHGQKVARLVLSGVDTVWLGEVDAGEKLVTVAPGDTRTPAAPPGGGASKTALLVGVAVLAVFALGAAAFSVVRSNNSTATANLPPVDNAGGTNTNVDPSINVHDTLLKKGTVRITWSVSSTKGKTSVTGSGTIISAGGLILTNAHVAAPNTPGAPEAGSLPDPEELLISVNVNGNADPVEPRYIGKVIAADGPRDLAVIQITESMGGKKLTKDDLQAELDDAVVPIADAADIKQGERVWIYGFPGIAQSKGVTQTDGIVSGFADKKDTERFYINTNGKFEAGNSGGLAANANGEIIGVPDVTTCKLNDPKNPDGGCSATQNRLLNIGLATDLIAAARAGEPYSPKPI